MPTSRKRPLCVAILDDHQVIVAGLTALFERHPGRATLVPCDGALPPGLDVVLHDAFRRPDPSRLDLADVVRGSEAKVVVYSWSNDINLIERALSKGAAGYIVKSATASELLDAVERVADGETVRPAGTAAPDDPVLWPGQDQGLTPREAEVITLIVQGMSNQEIADRKHLSVNTIKTYIRTAYRTMGVGRRADAVRWGLEHGLMPDPTGTVGDA